MDYAIREEFADSVRSPRSLVPPGHIYRLGTGTVGTDDVSLGNRIISFVIKKGLFERYIRVLWYVVKHGYKRVALDLELIYLII